MTENIIQLASHNPARRVRACAECRFLMVGGGALRSPSFWKCGVSGHYCATEMLMEDGCGPQKRLWEERPPRLPGFWTRLGDAIIAWIDRMDRHEEDRR